MFVQLFSVIEKHNNEFAKILLGQFFGCAAPTEPISMGAIAPIAPKKSAPMESDFCCCVVLTYATTTTYCCQLCRCSHRWTHIPISFIPFVLAFVTVWRYASAVHAMALCPFVHLSVLHKSEFYWNRWTDRAHFWHGGFFWPVLLCF